MKKQRRKVRRGGLAPDKYLSREENKRLSAHVRRQAATARQKGRCRARTNEMIIVLGLYAGLRAGEIIALKIQNLPMHHGKQVIDVVDGKGQVSRSVIIPRWLARMLADYVKCCRKGAKPGSFLFLNERESGPMSYRSIYSKVRKIGEAAGVELHPHKLRHTYLVHLYNVKGGNDIWFCQAQAGHASMSTTAVYSQTEISAGVRQVELLPGWGD